jgi:hypothetical protein
MFWQVGVGIWCMVWSGGVGDRGVFIKRQAREVWFAVKTTTIKCRTSCGAKLISRGNLFRVMSISLDVHRT